MGGEGIFAIVIGMIVVSLFFRLIAGGIDGERIESYVADRGWTLVDKSWDPFGPGWFGEKDSRIYQIVYRDARGDTHKAHVKTAMFSGVYLTNDHIVKYADEPRREATSSSSAAVDEAESLRRENDRLRRKIHEFEGGVEKRTPEGWIRRFDFGLRESSNSSLTGDALACCFVVHESLW